MLVTQVPDKLFFKIGEVAKIVGVKAHVLRYWEDEFQALRPMKTRGAHRVYRRRDVELAVLIRRLLQDEGFTVPGARKRLRELGHHRVSSESDAAAVREVDLRAELLWLRRELGQLAAQAERLISPERVVSPRSTATITGANPSQLPSAAPSRTAVASPAAVPVAAAAPTSQAVARPK